MVRQLTHATAAAAAVGLAREVGRAALVFRSLGRLEKERRGGERGRRGSGGGHLETWRWRLAVGDRLCGHWKKDDGVKSTLPASIYTSRCPIQSKQFTT